MLSAHPRINFLLADNLDNLGDRLGHSLVPLGLRHEEGVEHGDSLAEHRDLKLLLVLEVVHELLQGHLPVSARLHSVQLEPDIVIDNEERIERITR